MTSKQEALVTILRSMREYTITLDEIAQAQVDIISQKPIAQKPIASAIAMKIFSYLGAIFVLGGISAYISMFWATMSPFMRIFVTLGVGVGLSALSLIAMKEGKYPRIILPLIIIAALIETTGWFVFISEMFPEGNDARKAACIVFGVMALQHWCSYGIFKRTALFSLAVLFSYGFLANALDILGLYEECIGLALGASLFCVSDWASTSPHRIVAGLGFFCAIVWFNEGLYNYMGKNTGWPEAGIATGLSICSMAYAIRHRIFPKLSSFFFFLGSVLFYAGLFDWVRHTPYELLYLGIAIAMMYGHIVIESGAILLTSTLAILGFIGYYTAEHFVNSVGWPIALILLGIAFLAVAAFAMRIKHRGSVMSGQ